MTTQLNKIYAIKTIALVAREFGEDEDWLTEIIDERAPEDGLIWVYGPDGEGAAAFSDFGVEKPGRYRRRATTSGKIRPASFTGWTRQTACRRQRAAPCLRTGGNRVAAPTGLPRRLTTPVAGERPARAAGEQPQSRLRAVPLDFGVR
jgi:hypothetical protein